MSLREELVRLFPRLEAIARGTSDPLYVAGGAVRDLLRGAEPADVDVATLDPRSAAERIGRRVIPLGREQLAAWRVADGGHVYDFAPLLGGEIATDLARRDFTVNAMAVDLRSGELIDPHGGRADLERRRVAMVRASNFDDDPLRLLKAVRMAVLLRFEIEHATLEAIRARAGRIVEPAPERVSYELSRILSAGAFRRAAALLDATRLGEALGLRPAAPAADDVPLAAALAMLVPDPPRWGERWKWSRRLVRDVTVLQALAGAHDAVRLFEAGEEVARQLPALLRAMGRDPGGIAFPDFATRPLLTGDAIARLTGLDPGPELGAVSRALLEAQLRGEVTGEAGAEAFVRARMPR